MTADEQKIRELRKIAEQLISCTKVPDNMKARSRSHVDIVEEIYASNTPDD